MRGEGKQHPVCSYENRAFHSHSFIHSFIHLLSGQDINMSHRDYSQIGKRNNKKMTS